MQAFVRRTALTLKPDESVPIIVYFEDGAAIPSEVDQAGPDAPQRWTRTPSPPAGRQARCSRTAGARPTASASSMAKPSGASWPRFPEHAQRKRPREFMGYFAAHGVEVAKWPRAAMRARPRSSAAGSMSTRCAGRRRPWPARHCRPIRPPTATGRKPSKLQTNVLALPLAHVLFSVSNNEDWIDSLVFMVSDSGPPLEQLDLRGITFSHAPAPPAGDPRDRARRLDARQDIVHRLAAGRGLSDISTCPRKPCVACGLAPMSATSSPAMPTFSACTMTVEVTIIEGVTRK